jgi:hypothetical protein
MYQYRKAQRSWPWSVILGCLFHVSLWASDDESHSHFSSHQVYDQIQDCQMDLFLSQEARRAFSLFLRSDPPICREDYGAYVSYYRGEDPVMIFFVASLCGQDSSIEERVITLDYVRTIFSGLSSPTLRYLYEFLEKYKDGKTLKSMVIGYRCSILVMLSRMPSYKLCLLGPYFQEELSLEDIEDLFDIHSSLTLAQVKPFKMVSKGLSLKKAECYWVFVAL